MNKTPERGNQPRQLIKKVSHDMDEPDLQGDIAGEFQEAFTQYLKTRGWTENDFGTKQVTTEQADWLSQLNDAPEVVNGIVLEAIQSETKILGSDLETGDAAKAQVRIDNLRKMLDKLERGIK